MLWSRNVPWKSCLCTRPVSPELLEHHPQGMEQGGCTAVRQGLTMPPERLVNTETVRAFLSSTCGWILSSPWWKGKGQDVIFNFT